MKWLKKRYEEIKSKFLKTKLVKESKSAFLKLKSRYFRARCHYIQFYECFPIQEKCILLESDHGKKINGNIFYILQYLCENEKFRDWEIFVSSTAKSRKSIRALLDSYGFNQVQLITHGLRMYFKLLARAKYLINDNTFHPAFIKKEGQIYFNTWHGTPLKSLGRGMLSDRHLIGNQQKNFIDSDFILFPNAHTRDVLIQDFMLENLSKAVEVYGGYPRNTVFFDKERQIKLKEEYNPEGKRLYTYMPTYRGNWVKGGTDKNEVYLKYFLFELDKHLTDDEILYLNLHPTALKKVDFKNYKHIKNFPTNLETYDFLNIVDCLITDYSSVFFDFVNTGKKIVLFPYDEEEYWAERGMYLNLNELPFPKVYDLHSLLLELRKEKNYDDSEFIKTFCPYENKDATRKLCDFIFNNRRDELFFKENKSNGKENVLIYVGNLAQNGITSSIRNLLNRLDLEKRNYFLSFIAGKVGNNQSTLATFPKGVNYVSIMGEMNLTMLERIVRYAWNKKLIPTFCYMKWVKKRIQEEWLRCFGNIRFDSVIQFSGYESEVILMYSQFQGKKAIFVHNNMVQEIKVKGNQRRDVLQYVYPLFDKVALITQDLRVPTKEIAGSDHNFVVSKNVIDDKSIREKALLPIELNPQITTVYPSEARLYEILASKNKKFINIGRFSPEKGQLRLLEAFASVLKEYPDIYLVVIGGNSFREDYEKVKQHIAKLNLEESVLLIKNIPNPFPVLAQCDYLVLSSFHEGLPVVFAEADILGKPCVSTHIPGPASFMQQYNGMLVENSVQGIVQGMVDLLNAKGRLLTIDYNAYNQEAVEAFENVLRG